MLFGAHWLNRRGLSLALLASVIPACSDAVVADALNSDDALAFDVAEPEAASAATCAHEGSSCAHTGCCPLLLCLSQECRAPEASPLLRSGLHPKASDALRLAGTSSQRIFQTIGDAPASGGTHGQDGEVGGMPFSAATDIDTEGLNDERIRNLLERLGRLGFAAWYRKPGADGWPTGELPHVHAVYAACKMKPTLSVQVSDWQSGGNGLLNHGPYEFYTWSATAQEAVRLAFAASGQGAHD